MPFEFTRGHRNFGLTRAEVVDLEDKVRNKLRALRDAGLASVPLVLNEDELQALIIALEDSTIWP